MDRLPIRQIFGLRILVAHRISVRQIPINKDLYVWDPRDFSCDACIFHYMSKHGANLRIKIVYECIRRIHKH